MTLYITENISLLSFYAKHILSKLHTSALEVMSHVICLLSLISHSSITVLDIKDYQYPNLRYNSNCHVYRIQGHHEHMRIKFQRKDDSFRCDADQGRFHGYFQSKFLVNIELKSSKVYYLQQMYQAAT